MQVIERSPHRLVSGAGRTSPAPHRPDRADRPAPSWRGGRLRPSPCWITSVWRCSQLTPAPSAGSSCEIEHHAGRRRAGLRLRRQARRSPPRSSPRPAPAAAPPAGARRYCCSLRPSSASSRSILFHTSISALVVGSSADRCRAGAAPPRRRAIAPRRRRARRRARAGSRRPRSPLRAWRGRPRPAWSAGRR